MPRLIHSLVAVALLLLVLSLAAPPVTAAVVEAQGTVTGPGVDGTIVLRFDTDGGGVEGSATINIQRSCKNGQKLEIRSMTIHQGRISNGQLVATAVFDGSDWPYGFGRVCRGADGSYSQQTSEDSMRLNGQIDLATMTVSGTASRSPTLYWTASWAPPPVVDQGSADGTSTVPQQPLPGDTSSGSTTEPGNQLGG